jgi:hypothetical protein
VGIEHHLVTGAQQPHQQPEIGLVAGGEQHRRGHVVECGELRLQRGVAVETAIGHARAGRAAALFVDRLTGRVDQGRIKGQPEIVVGSHEDRRLAVDHGLGGRQDLFHHDAAGIGGEAAERIADMCQFGEAV